LGENVLVLLNAS